MRRILFVLLFVSIVTNASLATASFSPFCSGVNNVQNIVGVVKFLDGNSLQILDERDKFLKKFLFYRDTASLQVGDRVRVYYYSSGDVQSVKKMTPVEYKKDRQNLGVFFKSE